jgi:ankyrin repeat protein
MSRKAGSHARLSARSHTARPGAPFSNRLAASVAALTLAFAAIAAHAAPKPADLFRAIESDRASAVRQLLDEGLDPNLAEPARGDTALIVALRENADAVFQLLLSQPATRLEATAGNGDTALMVAAYLHKEAAVQALLARGAAVNRPNWTPLHYAASAGDVAIMRILLAHGARIDAVSDKKLTPLMLAARDGQESAVRLLLEQGADPALVSAYGWDAEQFARATTKPAIAALIATARQRKSGAAKGR